MCIVASTSFLTHSGLIKSAMDLKFRNHNIDQIVLNGVQTFPLLAMTLFLYKMPRIKWLKIFQGLTLISVIILLIISKQEKTEGKETLKLILSVFVIGFCNGACFPLIFIFICEVFPTRIRGIASGIVFTVARTTSLYAHIISNLATDNGYHVICGCAATTLISFPLLFCLKETLILPKKKKKKKENFSDYTRSTKTEESLIVDKKIRESLFIEDVSAHDQVR